MSSSRILPLEPAGSLDPAEIRRYGRHLLIPEVGIEGQERLKAARILLIGAGGLGSPAALYLAAAGVGTIGIVEFDTVDATNLQRQILYGSADVGRPKIEIAAERIGAINPHVRVRPHAVRLEASNALELLADYDVVVDGSDNFATRYVVNDSCALLGKPLVYGAVLRFEGQLSVFWRPHGPCYRCLFPAPPPPGLVPSCAEAGVLGVLPGLIGVMQANEAIKLILGQGEPLIGRYLVVDALGMSFRELRLPRDPECPVCGDHPTITEPIDIEAGCEVPTSRSEGRMEIGVDELHQWRTSGRPHQLIDVREPFEEQVAKIDGATLVPMRSLPERLEEIARDRPVVVFCHHGGRSASAVNFLRTQGIDASLNLVGGIDAWSREVDASVSRY